MSNKTQTLRRRWRVQLTHSQHVVWQQYTKHNTDDTHSPLLAAHGIIITKVQEEDHANPLADLPPRSSQSNHLHHQPNHLRRINLTTCAQSTQPPPPPDPITCDVYIGKPNHFSPICLNSDNPPPQTLSFSTIVSHRTTGSPVFDITIPWQKDTRSGTSAIQHTNHRGKMKPHPSGRAPLNSGPLLPHAPVNPKV